LQFNIYSRRPSLVAAALNEFSANKTNEIHHYFNEFLSLFLSSILPRARAKINNFRHSPLIQSLQLGALFTGSNQFAQKFFSLSSKSSDENAMPVRGLESSEQRGKFKRHEANKTK
jgi:hypothetical protein